MMRFTHHTLRWSAAGATPLLLAFVFDTNAAGAPAPHDEPVLTVAITDANGQAVPDAQAYLIENSHGMPLSYTWQQADSAGIAHFDLASLRSDAISDGATQSATLVVRSPHHAWSMQKLTIPAVETVNVSLSPGRVLTLSLTPTVDADLPADLVPVIFTEGQSVCAWLTAVQGYNKEHGPAALFNPALPRPEGAGRFTLRVPGDCENLWVIVNHPGFLRAFQAGPFATQSGDGTIGVPLPLPATLAIRLAPDEAAAHDYRNCGVIVYASPEIPDGGWSFSVHTQYVESTSLSVDLPDLAPQYYSVNAVTGTKADQSNRDRPDYFRTQSGARLEPAGRSELAFPLQTYDEAAQRARLKGDHKLTVKVTNADGSPASGSAYQLAFSLQQFGRSLTIADGTLPESGEFTVEGLPHGGLAYLKASIDGNDAGYIFIKEDEPHTTFEVSVAPAVGAMAPEIELTRLDDDSTFRLSSLRGQVVYLDFWASWCGPCQEPMAHSDSLMSRRTDWKGKALIIGASIDNGIEIIRDHVNKREWTNVLQTFCSEGPAGWQCTAAKRYAVRGVPTCYLIDQQGRITWTGHPSEIDAEAEIDALLTK